MCVCGGGGGGVGGVGCSSVWRIVSIVWRIVSSKIFSADLSREGFSTPSIDRTGLMDCAEEYSRRVITHNV